MTIIEDKKEVHLCNPSLRKLVEAVEYIRSQPALDDYKIMIDGTDENTNTEGGLQISE